MNAASWQIMLSAIEIFFTAYQHTVAALAAMSTFAAVVVSLVVTYISQRTNRTRIKASATVMFVMHLSLKGKPRPTYVTVSITNLGILPATVQFSFFYWRLPFAKGVMLITPLNSSGDDWIPKRTYPFEIKPRQSETFYLSEISVFRESILKNVSNAGFFQRLRFRFLHARVITADGRTFNVKLDRSLREELRELRDMPTATEIAGEFLGPPP